MPPSGPGQWRGRKAASPSLERLDPTAGIHPAGAQCAPEAAPLDHLRCGESHGGQLSASKITQSRTTPARDVKQWRQKPFSNGTLTGEQKWETGRGGLRLVRGSPAVL